MGDYPFDWPGVPLSEAARADKDRHAALHTDRPRPKCRWCQLEAETTRAAQLLAEGRLRRG